MCFLSLWDMSALNSEPPEAFRHGVLKKFDVKPLFLKACPVRPYNINFYIFGNAERLTAKKLYYIAPYIHIAKARGFTAKNTEY